MENDSNQKLFFEMRVLGGKTNILLFNSGGSLMICNESEKLLSDGNCY